MNTMKTIAKTIWCHRVAYAGLALAYGAGCMGWIDKETVAQIVTALYVALTTQRH
ncbi:MAG: hypothetical protein OXQ92_05650 [Boseongicola sp.]|nr:hypothetical protein [Boseongicola sp.]MDD9976987.1 hypothetical protein [Boseongicola sp.]